MKLRLILLLYFGFNTFLGLAQEDYFQQEVNMKIDVTLDDEAHTLTGTVEMEYINHSPDVLNEIYLHLWANAYKSRKTAFAKQKLRTGSTEFYFSKDSDYGNFSGLNFKADDKSLVWEYDQENPDIALLKLNEPLSPGDKVIITSPFTLKIPASFSRLGHVGQSYQMTQWYPKPAVYDKDGWHPMPYLDMGEFYSEFGNFDVKITLPENYVVGATGEVQNQSEIDFLLKRAEDTKAVLNSANSTFPKDTFPASSPVQKTLHYKAEKVHDFAWFADKRFYVQKSEVAFPSGNTVDTWTMFTNAEIELWKQSIEYVDRAVKFYSEKVGEYPYPQATAVQSALSAGGGMEYPMITVIGLSGDAQSLDGVITHEVGHNWFYGILAFDERDHPWLDEGLNSYYDHRYNDLYYEQAGFEFLPDFLMKGSDLDILELAYLFQARRDLDQAPETTSDDFKLINYFLGAYEKPARFFKYLEMYLGTEEFDRIMQGFYEKWKFKHPQPEDLRSYFEMECDKNLDWLFDGMINSNEKTDYKIKGLKKENDFELTIKNKGKVPGPFPLSGMKNGEIVETQWYDGFQKTKKVTFPDGDYDQIVLDQQGYSLDIDRKNNNIKTSGPFKTLEPLRFKFLAGIENSKKTTIYWLPTLAWNNYDKFMLGLALYNTTIPANKFEFALAPMYAFGSKDITGLANFKYHLFPESNALQRVTFDLGLKSFNYNYISNDDYHLKYTRVRPSLKFDLGKKRANSTLNQSIELNTNFITEEIAERDTMGIYLGNNEENSWIHQLIYSAENRRALNPYSIKLLLEQQSYESFRGGQNYLKASLELKTAYTYNRGKNIDFRFFIGSFLQNTRRDAGAVTSRALGVRGSYGLAAEGYNDYIYDHLYFGRNDQTGFWSRQVTMDQGGFKNAFGGTFSTGQSNSFIFAMNIKADLPQDLPLKLPLKPYFDWGYWDNAMPIAEGATFKEQVMWSGGVMLEFFDDALALYFPIVNSDNIKSNYGNKNFWGKISFTANLNKANPWRLVDRIEF